MEFSRRHHGRHDAGLRREWQHGRILKPSIDSPTIAAKFFELLEEAGLPDGVVNFCPGHGNSFGNAIVEHPQTRYIAFTGSKEVGLHINQRAAVQQPGQIWIKRTVLEMGGKDSIVVDTDAWPVWKTPMATDTRPKGLPR